MGDLEDKIKELKRKIEDIKKRWPSHSPKVSMFQELETLDFELEALEKLKTTQR
ncbi:MAG: histidine kinase [Bacillota bacterium]|nr:histidine kinase [Bacillota bacterium]